MTVYTGLGEQKREDEIPAGFICGLHNEAIPAGWSLCDGTNGTPDLRGRVMVGAATLGLGSAGGTVDANTALTHAGFALADHAAHAVTQPSAHAAHAVTQAADHTLHTGTPPANHADHSSAGSHTHDAHTLSSDGSLAVATNKYVGPTTHSADGGHTHDAHSAHTFSIGVGSSHSGMTVDAHSAHAGMTVDAHSSHSMTQPSAHQFQSHTIPYIMKI